MKVLVVYDSFFGNTEKVANAIGEVLQPQHTVTVARANEVTPRPPAPPRAASDPANSRWPFSTACPRAA